MIYAQIKNEIVVNTIILDDAALLPLFQNDPMTGEPYDLMLQIDMVYPRPGIGWIFNGLTFIAPPPSPEIEEDV